MRPRERVKPKPKERAPICEPGDPVALERCWATAPEEWTEEVLRAAVELQRKEREGRLAKVKVKERKCGTSKSKKSLSETEDSNGS